MTNTTAPQALIDALDPDTLEAIANEIDDFENSARADSLRIIAKRQRAALSAAQGAPAEPDPHGTRYHCERAALALGHMSDDELANGAFMNYDQKLDIGRVLANEPDYHPPIVWMTAVKDRIRWLSRQLAAARASQPTPAQDAAATVPVGELANGWIAGRAETYASIYPYSTLAEAYQAGAEFALRSRILQAAATPPAAPQASAVPGMPPMPPFTPEQRAAACVAACEGLPDHALYGGWTAAGMSRYTKSLEDKLAAPQAVPLTDAQAPAGQGRLPCGHEQALLIRSAQTGEPLYCEACDDKSGRADAEAMEQELREKLDAATLKPQAPALVPLTGHHKLDNDQQVFFYEQDFYVLSNFSSFALHWRGLDFPTSEHAYHWEKFNIDGAAQAESVGAQEREAILRAAVAAMPHTNPLVADDLIEGHTMHTEAEDIIAIWQAARSAAQGAVQVPAWVSVHDALPAAADDEDVPVWTWDGISVNEDNYGPIFEQPAGPAVGGWLNVGHGFVGDTMGRVTHWMPRPTPAAPAHAGERSEGGADA